MARHKSNVDFRRFHLHDGGAKRSAHHCGRDLQIDSSPLCIIHVQIQIKIGSNHAAQQGRAAAQPDTRRGGDISRHFQLRGHGCEFQRH